MLTREQLVALKEQVADLHSYRAAHEGSNVVVAHESHDNHSAIAYCDCTTAALYRALKAELRK